MTVWLRVCNQVCYRAGQTAGQLKVAVARIGIVEDLGLRYLLSFWAPLALLGATQIAFNWTTGAIAFAWIYVRVPAVGAGRFGAFGPWLVLVSVPVGAILAFEGARKHRREHLANQASDIPSAPIAAA